MKINKLLLSLVLVTSASVSANEGMSFSLSSGAPFFLNPEVSYSSKHSETRYYGNLKLGLDNGASLGFETSISESNQHALGAFIGSIGVHDGEDDCLDEQDDPNSLGEGLGQIIGCSLVDVFDWERVDGVGVTYSYNFNTLNQSSWFVRLEAGYGKGAESDRDLSSGALLIGYRF